MAFNFFSPIVVLFLFIPSLSTNFLVPDVMSKTGFEGVKISILCLIIFLKGYNYYEELQFNFNKPSCNKPICEQKAGINSATNRFCKQAIN